MDGIAQALREIRARLEAALALAGRPPGAATLVAISKRQPESALRAAYAAGQRDFGESYAQELRDKARALGDLPLLRWHFVGHLQPNKAKYVAETAGLVHALDAIETAKALANRAGGRRLRCLVQVNLGREPQKRGVPAEAAESFCRSLLHLPEIELAGLMCLPPEGEAARPHFAALGALRDDIARSLGTRLPELSMGMSLDFEDAVREGATLVRVGSAIFGARP